MNEVLKVVLSLSLWHGSDPLAFPVPPHVQRAGEQTTY